MLNRIGFILCFIFWLLITIGILILISAGCIEIFEYFNKPEPIVIQTITYKNVVKIFVRDTSSFIILNDVNNEITPIEIDSTYDIDSPNDGNKYPDTKISIIADVPANKFDWVKIQQYKNNDWNSPVGIVVISAEFHIHDPNDIGPGATKQQYINKTVIPPHQMSEMQ